jgi:hypothetical protein
MMLKFFIGCSTRLVAHDKLGLTGLQKGWRKPQYAHLPT